MLPKTIIIFDTETTGLDFELSEIIEFSYIKVEDSQILETVDEVLKPENKVDQFNLAYTGIGLDELDKGLDAREIIGKFVKQYPDIPVVGHNIKFDVKMVQRYFPEYNPPEIDTQKLAEIIWPTLSSYSLENISETFKLVREGAHRSLFDVKSTYNLLLHEVKTIKKMDPKSAKVISEILKKDPNFDNTSSIFDNDTPTDSINLQNFIKENQAKKDIHEHTEKELMNYLNNLDGKKLVIASLDVFAQIQYSKEVNILSLPNQILSPQKLIAEIKSFLEDPKLEKGSIKAFILAKIFSFLSISNFGRKHSLSIRGKEENSLWYESLCEDENSIKENPGFFWQKIKKHEATTDIHLLQSSGLMYITQDKIDEYDHLIIYPLESAEREITSNNTAKLSLTQIHDTLPEEYTKLTNELEEHMITKSLGENSNIMAILETIKENLSEEDPSYKFLLQYIEKSKDKNWFSYYNSFQNDNETKNYFLLSSPIYPHTLFSHHKNIHFLSAYKPNDNELNLVNHFFGTTDIKILTTEDKPKLEILYDAPAFGSNSYTEKSCQYLVDTVKNLKGKTFILSPGGSNFASTLWTIWNNLETIPYTCIAEGVGGKNTNLEKIRRLQDEDLIIIGGENLYKSMPVEIRENISRCYYTKLQFPNTFNAFGKARANQFTNSFIDYSLPHASLMLKSFLLMTRKKDKSYPELFITDSRTWQKDYGKSLIKNFAS